MAVRVVRLGTARARGEGLRLGTVRRPPRGVAKADYARRDFFDLWMPDLAPSAPLIRSATSSPWTDASWARFRRKYRREMADPRARRLIAMLAALSRQTSFAVGCYCADGDRCHRSLLRELLVDAGADVAADRRA
jgi:uncharacterized protein YeaO (DUF488 family)